MPPHTQSSVTLCHIQGSVNPYIEQCHPIWTPWSLWGGQGARPGAAAQRGVAPGRDWAHSGLGEIERNKQIRGQIPPEGDGRGERRAPVRQRGEDFGEQSESGVCVGGDGAFLLPRREPGPRGAARCVPTPRGGRGGPSTQLRWAVGQPPPRRPPFVGRGVPGRRGGVGANLCHYVMRKAQPPFSASRPPDQTPLIPRPLLHYLPRRARLCPWPISRAGGPGEHRLCV